MFFSTTSRGHYHRSPLTGEDEGDESEERVAAPEDNAGEHDVTDERLDVLDNHRLLIAAHHNHLLLLLL